MSLFETPAAGLLVMHVSPLHTSASTLAYAVEVERLSGRGAIELRRYDGEIASFTLLRRPTPEWLTRLLLLERFPAAEIIAQSDRELVVHLLSPALAPPAGPAPPAAAAASIRPESMRQPTPVPESTGHDTPGASDEVAYLHVHVRPAPGNEMPLIGRFATALRALPGVAGVRIDVPGNGVRLIVETETPEQSLWAMLQMRGAVVVTSMAVAGDGALDVTIAREMPPPTPPAEASPLPVAPTPVEAPAAASSSPSAPIASEADLIPAPTSAPPLSPLGDITPAIETTLEALRRLSQDLRLEP